jgi:hypothetical protein
MRIRSIKPEFWRSSDISKLSIEDRLLFIGLWSYVDDNGVGVDKLAAIAADLFADDIERDAPEAFARVSRGLQNLAEGDRIIRYTVDGAQYLSITNWGKHQRIDKPGKPRFPRHDAEDAEIRESVARVSETFALGTGEQRNRGTEEQSKKTSPAKPNVIADEFIDWYLEYPRKESKGVAEKAYAKARKLATAEQLIEGAIRYRDDPNRDAGYTKLPATWLNAKCWEDGPLPERNTTTQARPTGSQVRLQAGFELVERTRARMAQQQPQLPQQTHPQFEIED